MTVRGGGVRKNHGFHAVVQNGSRRLGAFAADAQDCIMVRGRCGPTEYKVAARMFVRDKRAPLDPSIPTTTSELPCSGLSRYGLASPRA